MQPILGPQDKAASLPLLGQVRSSLNRWTLPRSTARSTSLTPELVQDRSVTLSCQVWGDLSPQQ